jgi:hypothetical protein
MLVKRAAGVLNLLESGWILYIVLVFMNRPYACPSDGCPPIPNFWVFDSLLLLGAMLLIDAAVSFTGRWPTFPLGALFSIVAIPLVALQWGAFGTTYAIVAMVLAVSALIFNVIATISRTKLSEQEHPLNLPVFG